MLVPAADLAHGRHPLGGGACCRLLLLRALGLGEGAEHHWEGCAQWGHVLDTTWTLQAADGNLMYCCSRNTPTMECFAGREAGQATCRVAWTPMLTSSGIDRRWRRGLMCSRLSWMTPPPKSTGSLHSARQCAVSALPIPSQQPQGDCTSWVSAS